MKKAFLASLVFAATTSVMAADYINVDVELVNDRNDGPSSVAQTVSGGRELAGIQWGLQARTARFEDNGGLSNRVELTAGKNIGAITPFVGVAHDNGFNGAGSYNYGLVGVVAGTNVGPGLALAGVKTRVGSTEDTQTKQTLAFVTYSIPVTKAVSVNLNASRSFQDIKEDAVGAGISIKF